MIKNTLLITLLSVSLSGCFTMVNRKNPSANFDYDYAQCENEAMMRVPAVVPPRSAPSYTTNCSRSGNNVSCTSEPDSNDAKAQAEAQMETYNRRGRYKQNCLSLKGWVAESRK